MTKNELLEIRKSLLRLGLLGVSTATLTGCTETNQNQNTAGQTSALTAEVSTEENTEAYTEEESNKETKDYYALACEFERNYTQFCTESKLAYYNEDGSINIDRIENIIKVINGEVADLTPAEVNTAAKDIEQILLPQELEKACNFISKEERGLITIEGNFNICEAPKLSTYTSNVETKEFVCNKESARDELIDEINSTNKISEETKTNWEQAVIDMQKEYKNSKNYGNTDTVGEGYKLLLNTAKLKTIDIAFLVIASARIYDDEFPGGLKIAAETEEESYVMALYTDPETRNAMTDEQKELYTRTRLDLIPTVYEENICKAIEVLGDYAANNKNTYSYLDDIDVKHYTKTL